MFQKYDGIFQHRFDLQLCQPRFFINQIRQSRTDVFLFYAPHIGPSEVDNGGTCTWKSIEFDKRHNARVWRRDHAGEGDAWETWRAFVLSLIVGHRA